MKRTTRTQTDWELLRVHITRLASDGHSLERLAARFQCNWQTMKRLFGEWGINMKKQTVYELKPRNDRILELVDAHVKDSVILRMLKKDYPDMTRQVVIGIRYRHRGKLAVGETKLSSRRNSRSLGGQRKPVKMLTPPKPVPTEPRIAKPSASIEAQMAEGWRESIANSPPAMPAIDTSPAPSPSGERWVSYGSARGCTWIEGDVREGTAVVCNAPKCMVTRAGDSSKTRFPTSYCGEHWDARRSSKFTKVVA